MSALMKLGGLIRPFEPAEGAPPQQLGAFFRWCLSGSWPMLFVAAAISSVAGATEVVSALILGWVIDAAVNSGPTRFFADHTGLLIVFLGFYLVLRPLAFGVSAASTSIIIGPNIMPLVLSRRLLLSLLGGFFGPPLLFLEKILPGLQLLVDLAQRLGRRERRVGRLLLLLQRLFALGQIFVLKLGQESVPVLIAQLGILHQLTLDHQGLNVVDGVDVVHGVHYNLSHLLESLIGSNAGHRVALN